MDKHVHYEENANLFQIKENSLENLASQESDSIAFLNQKEIEDAVDSLHTIRDLLRWAMSCFNEAGINYGQGAENAFEEAMLLVLPTLHLPIEGVEGVLNTRVTRIEKLKVIQNIKQRILDRKPSAYITNKAWFCDLEFYVDERVLIPRSPIGELIQNQFSGLLPYEPKRILDLCTGSGCLAIACAQLFPHAEIDAIDISADALQVAEVNIQRYELEMQITPILSDLFEKIKNQKYDLIISNPPYVDNLTLSQVPKEFTFEPRLGFEAGQDGLLFVNRILRQAHLHLEEEGVLICELGETSANLQEAFPEVPFHWIEKKRGGISVFAINKEALETYSSETRDSFVGT